MRIKSGAVGFIILAVFFAGIAGSMATGLWTSSTEKHNFKNENDAAINELFSEEITDDDVSGHVEAAEFTVKGSTTFQLLLDEGITESEIEEIINAPMPPSNQSVKDYCIEAGLTVTEIKDKLNGLL